VKTNSFSFILVISIFFLILLNQLAFTQTSFNISNKTTGDTLLTIDNNGRVGIGTTTPDASIDIKSSTVETASTLRLGNLDNSRYFSIYSGNATYSPLISWHEGAALRFAAWTDTYNEFMRLSAEGNLGIGTTDPTAKFTISGISESLNHGESAVFLQNSNRYFDFNGGMIFRGSGMNWNSRFTATDNLGADEEVVGIYKHEVTAGDVLNNATEVIAIFKNNGHVGIGLSDPDQGLVVADTIRSTLGGFQFPDGTVQETAAGGGGAGNTLDEAYDQGGAGAGAVINADAGIVQINGPDGLRVNGVIDGYGGFYLNGSGVEGGQASLVDGDGQGGWEIDNYGGTDHESFRVFRGSGFNNIFNALVIGDTGNVGIGVGGPDYQLDVDGIIQSRSGGFRFPDGTLQGTAAGVGVFSIDDLSDARSLGNSVFLGSGAGVTDDGTNNLNVAVGIDAMTVNTAGSNNTAVGYSALNSNTTGNFNTGLGLSALYHNTTGWNNVAIGNSANFRNQEGSENTIVGVQAGYGTALHNKSGNVFLGFNAGYFETGSNKLYIENSNVSTPLIWGDFGEDSLRINGDLHITGDLHIDGSGGGAGNTLDQAYDQGGAGSGRIITADNGAVNIQGDDGLMVSGNVGIGMVLPPTYPLVVYPQTNTRGLYIGHGQTGPGETQSIYVDLTNSYSGDSDVYGAEIQTTNNNGAGSTNGIYAIADGSATGIKAGVQGRAEGPGLNFGVHGSVFGDGATASQIGVYGHATGSGNLLAGYFDGGNVYIRNRLGIGTTTPNAGLHLHGTGFPSSFMYLSSETGGSAGFRLYEGSTAKWHIFNSYTLDGFQIYNDNGQTVFYADQTTANVGIGTTNPSSKLSVAGSIDCDIITIRGGSDIAEPFDINNSMGIEAGMVMTIDSDNPGKLKISEKPYDRCVAGIISGAGGINPGMVMGQSGTIADGEFPVALTGRVYCRADASNGSINPGDLLTTSDIAGHAMKVVDYSKSQGSVIGKAMSSLDEGQGLILVLVSLQ